jgi:N-acetylglutamate synthase-like GNAT family acetyltransferase
VIRQAEPKERTMLASLITYLQTLTLETVEFHIFKAALFIVFIYALYRFVRKEMGR